MLTSNRLRRRIPALLLTCALFTATTAAPARGLRSPKSADAASRQRRQNNAEAYFQQALEYQRAGRYREAIELYRLSPHFRSLMIA